MECINKTYRSKKKRIKESNSKPKLLTQVRQKMRASSYSHKTIDSYAKWIKEFIIFNNIIHPEKLDKEEVEKFLTYLAVERNVSASTQNQELLGHNSLKTTMIYTYVIKQGAGIISPLDR